MMRIPAASVADGRLEPSAATDPRTKSRLRKLAAARPN